MGAGPGETPASWGSGPSRGEHESCGASPPYRHPGVLPDRAHLVTLRGKCTEPGFSISSLPLPNVTQRGSKSHLHLPSSHAEFHAHWRHWATARLKLILKHGFLLQLHWKKTLNLQGRTSPRTFLFCFSCCCYIYFFFPFPSFSFDLWRSQTMHLITFDTYVKNVKSFTKIFSWPSALWLSELSNMQFCAYAHILTASS